MFRSKKVRTFLIGVSLSFVISQQAFAASYTVQPGDSLYKISQKYNTSISNIMNTNRLSSNVIYTGQVLNVGTSTYTVKSGDSLYLIAKRFNITLDSLRKANSGISDEIYPGQKLNIPVAAQSTNAQTAGIAAQKTQTAAAITYSQSDLDLLARLVNAEAEGEPYNAKVAVAAVVINRVKSQQFPNTLKDVIYQKSYGYYQFTPVENGWINKTASQTAKDAAYEALHGSDPTHGALYYFDDSATNKWLWSKPLAARIGNMVYVY